MKTKTQRRYCGLGIAVLVSSALFAQPHEKHPPRGEAVQPLTVYTGKVLSFVPNEENSYDALLLETNGVPTTVKFPKHLGKQVMGAAKTGNTIHVNGFLDYTPLGQPEIHMVSLTSGNQTVYDIKMPKEPPVEQFTTVEGKVSDFARNKEGQINGVVINGNTILRFPKHSAYQLAGRIKNGDLLKSTGYVKPDDEGVVYATPTKVVRAETLVLNGTSYLIR